MPIYNPHGSLHGSSREAQELIAQIRETPLLGRDREIELAREMQNLRDLIRQYQKSIVESESIIEQERYHAMLNDTEDQLTSARDEFFYANIGLVLDIVNKRSRMEGIDMFQWGAIGLMRAIDLFDPGLNVKFSTYASRWIKQAIQRGCDNNESLIALPVHIRDMLKSLRRISLHYLQQNGESPSLGVICQTAGLDESRVRHILNINRVPLSLLQERAVTDDNVVGSLQDILPDTDTDMVDSFMERENLTIITNVVKQALSRLEEFQDESGETPFTIHCRVIRLRYRIGEPEAFNKRTLAEVSDLTGIPKNQVSLLQKVGIRWMLEHVEDLRALREE